MVNGKSDEAELGADLGPIDTSERISSLDTLRGIALFGILLMNIVGLGLPFAYGDPSIYGGSEGANLGVWVMNNMFFEGTMRGLFSMLFGAGIILLTSRAEARGGGLEVADIYYRRTLWLFLFGVFHAWLLLWVGDILYWYGIAGLFLFALRKLSPRALIVLGALALISVIPKHMYELSTTSAAWNDAQAAQTVLESGSALSDDQQSAIDGWQAIIEEKKHTPEQIADEIDGKRGNYFSVIASNTSFLVYFQSTRYYLYNFWDAIGMMLIGMGLLKLGVLSGRHSMRFYVTTMLIAYVIGLSVNAYETRLVVDSNFDTIAMLQAAVTYDLGRVPVTLGHMSLILLICKSGWLAGLVRRFAAVGRMALTNYIMHSVICAIVFTGVGFSLFGALERHQLYYVVVGIWILQLIISPIWLRHYRFGPLEWLWRSLTYWKRQPMRRVQTPPNLIAGAV